MNDKAWQFSPLVEDEEMQNVQTLKRHQKVHNTTNEIANEREQKPKIISKERVARKLPDNTFFSKVTNIFRKKSDNVTPSANKKKSAEVLDIMMPFSHSERLSSDAYGEKSVEEEPDSGKHRVKFYSSDDELDKFIISEEIIASKKITKEKYVPFRASVESTQDDDSAVHPTEISYFFRRGYRPDKITVYGEVSFLKKEMHSEDEDKIISLSERRPPKDFLLALGYNADDAILFVNNEELNGLLKAAIIEATIWENKISESQGKLLVLLASKAKPMIMKYYVRVAEAIVNNRINSAVKLVEFLRLLEKVEDGQISVNSILGYSKLDEDEDEGKTKKSEMKEFFQNIYTMALEEAIENGKTSLSEVEINQLHYLTINYKAVLQPYLPLLSQFIGRSAFSTHKQLEAAMIYLSTRDPQHVNMEKFKKFCGIVKS